MAATVATSSLVILVFVLVSAAQPGPGPCPENVPRVNCLIAPCKQPDSICPRYPEAVCVDDYCGDCNARFYVNGKEVTKFCPSSPPVCPDGKPPVQCFQEPCKAQSCQAFPNATCLNDYCGGCNARYVVKKREVTKQCCKKPKIKRCVQNTCTKNPCDPKLASCAGVPTATCIPDYCSGCKARWFLPNCNEVTEACQAIPPPVTS